MLSNIEIQNFRCFSTLQNIPIKPITLIYGANSSGKSSILKSMLLMEQTLEDASINYTLITKGQYVDVGNFKDFINEKDVTKSYSIKFKFDMSDPKERSRYLRGYHNRTNLFKNISKIAIEYVYKNTQDKYNPLKNINLYLNDEQVPLISMDKAPKSLNTGAYVRMRFGAFQTSRNNREPGNAFIIKKINWESQFFNDFWKNFTEKNKKENYLERVKQKTAHLEEKLNKAKENKEQAQAKFGFSKESLQELINTYKNCIKFLSKQPDGLLSEYKAQLMQYYSKNFMVFTNILFLDQIFSNEKATDYFSVLLLKSRNAFNFYYDDIDFNLDINHEFISLFYCVSNLMHSTLSNMKYLGALRDNPERYYLTTPTEKDYVGKSGKNTIDIIAKNTILKNKINKQLENLDLGYTIAPKKITNEDIYLFLLKETQSGIAVSLNDVGFGVSQILPILVQSMLSVNETILIEQPEIHIHPKLQAELGSLFAECIKEPYNNRFIIETHSENIILRLQKLIRQKVLSSDDISVIYVDKTSRGSVCCSLRLDENGNFLDRWPNGFFDESFEEIFD